ncbi:MAG: hypothetical protein WD063_17970 [Pirellulales bacterium]
METLERQVRRARRRLLVESLAGKLAWCWFFTLLVAVLAIGAGKFWAPVGQQAWATGWLALALGGGLAAAVLWTWLRRQSSLEAALEIDRRFGLKERVSSTLALAPAQLESEIGQALARDAVRSIRHVDVADRFRVRPDRRALLPVVPAALAVALAVFVPVRAPKAPANVTSDQQFQTQTSTRSLAKKIEARRKEAAERGLDELDPLLARLELGTKDVAESTALDRKKTLVALNDLVKEAEKRRRELSGAGELKKQLANLNDLEKGPADKLGQALEKGDFEGAMKHLEKLREDLAGDRLDPQAQKALAKQLDQLQRALEEKLQAQNQRERKLQEQIDEERRAGNVAKAEELQQQLDKLAAQRAPMEKLAQMQAPLKEAAQCLNQGDCDKAAAALAQLAHDLAGMQEDLEEMEMLEGALEQVADCKKAMACMECDGLGCEACQGGDWAKHGGELDPRFRERGGGKGIGVGLGPGLGPETKPGGKLYDSAVRQQPGKGAATVVGEADGPNRKGRAREEIQTEFSEARQNAADALVEQRLPRDYRDHAKKYFDALREGTR